MTVQVKVVRVRENRDLPLPRYQTAHAAGLDLQADLSEPLTLAPLERRLVPTGLSIELPVDHEAQIRPRSGLALKQGLTCLNSPGTIDADYRGEIMVLLFNASNQPVTLQRGDRIAQMVIAPVTRAELIEVDARELTQTTRGEKGFGSTGRAG